MAQQAKKTAPSQKPASAESLHRVAKECTGICSENMSALAESGNVAARIFQEASSEIIESCNRAFSDAADISKEAFACRTTNDMVALYDKMMQRTWNHYIEGTNKLCSMFINSYSEALEPLNERTAVTSERIRKAMAA